MPADPLHALIAGTLGVLPEEINELSDTGNTGRWDSLRHLMLMTELETHYGIEFTEQEMAGATSVVKIRALLGERGVG
jgi:acyl carrier protein